MLSVHLFIFSALVWMSYAQVTTMGTFNGILSFRNTLQRGPRFSAPCCNERYTEVATLVASATALNFSSTGITLSCGPSPPGWFAFANLRAVATNCYVGDIITGGANSTKGRIYWDGETVKTALYGNSGIGDCNFTFNENLECSGSDGTFFQPIVGSFYADPEPNEDYTVDGITVRTSCAMANCYLIFDDDQLLVVDTGIDDASTTMLIDAIQDLLSEDDLDFRAVFVTHSHPDHMNGVRKVKTAFPEVPIFVASEQIYLQTLIEYTSSRSGQDLSDVLEILEDPDQLWDGDTPLVITDNSFGYSAETTYYSLLWFVDHMLLFSGDFMYNEDHLWFGSSDFVDQCSWLNGLRKMSNMIPYNTAVFPGHGPMTTNATDLFEWNIEYIQDAREVYSLTCNINQTLSWLNYLYPELVGSSFLLQFGGASRVPSQAISLGCVCSSGSKSCYDQGVQVPTCYFPEITEDDCDSPESCGLVDSGLSTGAKVGIIIGSVAAAALLLIAVAILATGGAGGGDTYSAMN